MNKPVNFEIAKLLKEKGYNEGSFKRYDSKGILSHKNRSDTNIFLGSQTEAPTIAEVIMWLYEKYKIWIDVSLDLSNSQMFDYEIQKEHYLKISEDRFNSPTEAYEAAIEYTLNNLI